MIHRYDTSINFCNCIEALGIICSPFCKNELTYQNTCIQNDCNDSTLEILQKYNKNITFYMLNPDLEQHKQGVAEKQNIGRETF